MKREELIVRAGLDKTPEQIVEDHKALVARREGIGWEMLRSRRQALLKNTTLLSNTGAANNALLGWVAYPLFLYSLLFFLLEFFSIVMGFPGTPSSIMNSIAFWLGLIFMTASVVSGAMLSRMGAIALLFGGAFLPACFFGGIFSGALQDLSDQIVTKRMEEIFILGTVVGLIMNWAIYFWTRVTQRISEREFWLTFEKEQSQKKAGSKKNIKLHNFAQYNTKQYNTKRHTRIQLQSATPKQIDISGLRSWGFSEPKSLTEPRCPISTLM